MSLSLVLGVHLIERNVKSLIHYRLKQAPLILYLNQNDSDRSVGSLIQSIQSDSDISQVEYISPKKGLEDFIKSNHLAALRQVFLKNPLPGVVVVYPAHLSRLEEAKRLQKRFEQYPEVEAVEVNVFWITRHLAWLSLEETIFSSLFMIFLFHAVLTVDYMVRRHVMPTYQAEIDRLRLDGEMQCTLKMTRRVLLCLGAMMSWVASTLACLWVWCMQWYWAKAFFHFGGSLDWKGLNMKACMLTIVFGMVLVYSSTLFALRFSD